MAIDVQDQPDEPVLPVNVNVDTGTVQQHRSGEVPAPDSPAPASVANLRYRILRPHARGGLGEVFVALDTELRRPVALKEIQKRHANNVESRARFLLEAEVTGGLEHPNIVPVYGLGTYADGRPYYAMRFIRGDSLKDAIERFHNQPIAVESERNLAFRNLLKRFIDVCNAMAYAHSRGVLHRDLKPGNVMLGPYGETLVVDWGLAKVSGQASEGLEHSALPDEPFLLASDSSASAETQHGSTIGTPAFMSPEQAAGRLDQLGPASDVYSLGATLYVILTGKVAFEGDLGDVLPKVETGEFAPPRMINPKVPSALNAITLKAMARRPEDRYASPAALAEEIEHYLADEPVGAYAEPWPRRLERWERKHPGKVAGLTATLLVGIVAAGLATVLVNGKNFELAGANLQLDNANAELQLSNADLEVARKDAESKQRQAEAARDQARQRFHLALDAFNDMVVGIQTKLEHKPGTLDLRKDLLVNARKGLKKLLVDADQQGGPSHTLVTAHFNMGDVEQLFGDTPAAQAEYLAGNQLARAMADADPDNVDAMRNLSISFEKLAGAEMQLGRTQAALDLHFKSLAVDQKLAGAYPRNFEVQRDLGISHEKLGTVLLQVGRTTDAIDSFHKSLAVRQRLADDQPDNPKLLRDLGIGHEKIGDLAIKLGQTDDALVSYRKSLAVFQRLADADPKDRLAQRDLSIGFEKLGDVSLERGETDDALRYYRKQLAVMQRLAEDDPKNVQAQRDLRVSYGRLGDVSLQRGQLNEALEFYKQSLAGAQRLADDNPRNTLIQRDLNISFSKLGDVAIRQGRTKEAVDFHRKSLAGAERLAAADPANAEVQRDLSIYNDRLGDALLALGETKSALDAYRKSLTVRQRRVALEPKDAEAQRDLAISLERMGHGHRELKEYAEALRWYGQVLELVRRWPKPEELQFNLKDVEQGIADCKAALKPR